MKKLAGLITFTILLYAGLQNIRLVFTGVRYLAGLVAPFVIGGCIAFVLNLPVCFLETHLFSGSRMLHHPKLQKARRVCSLVLALALVCSVVSIVVFMVAPQLYDSIRAIGAELTQASVRVPQMLDEAAELLPMLSDELTTLKNSFQHTDWKAIGALLIDLLSKNNFLSNTLTLASSVANTVTNIVIGLVFAIYILLQKETLNRQFRRLLYSFLPEKSVDRFLGICRLTADSFNHFLSGQCLEAVILGLMFFVSMTLLRLPYALVISLLIGVTALIPIFGAFIGCAVGALLILIISPIKALWFIALFLVLQQVEGNIVYPRVVGSSVGLPSIWVLSAVTLGAGMGGVTGLLFAIPVCSVVYTLLRESVQKRIRLRKIDPNKIQ